MVDGERRREGYGEPARAGEEEVYVPRVRGEDEDVLTLVCVKCGTEYYFDPGAVPGELECEKCHNHVFRTFESLDADDEVAIDFSDSTDRDLHPDDPEGETLPGDIVDLNRD